MKLFISAIFMVIGFVSSVNGQTMMNTYTKCVVALENGDMDQVKSLAAVIAKKKNLTRDSIEKGKKCLEAAFDEIYEYHPDYKYWVKGEKAVALKQMLSTRKIRDQLAKRESCLSKKIAAIALSKEAILGLLTEDNNSFIAERTFEACVGLNETNPDAAILNPVCREAFAQKLHPELENEYLLKEFQKLEAEQGPALSDLARITKELDELLNRNKNTGPNQDSLREQAFQTCE